MTNQKHSSFWQQKSPLCLSAEGAVCAQSPAAGAALRFLQAGAVPRRKNRLSARGKHSDRVRWTKQGAVFGAALQFSQGRSCGPQGKLAKRKRTAHRGDPRCIFGQRQPGAALQFSQGRSCGPQGKSAKRKRQTQRPRPVDETGSCVWRRAPIFTRALLRPAGKIG